jgi:hypothetical protein
MPTPRCWMGGGGDSIIDVKHLEIFLSILYKMIFSPWIEGAKNVSDCRGVHNNNIRGLNKQLSLVLTMSANHQ